MVNNVKRKARRPRAKGRKAANLVKTIKKVIIGQAEKKIAFYSSPATGTNFNSEITSAGDCQVVMPDTILQGTGEGERLGNRIKLTSLNIKGHFSIKLNPTTSNYPSRVGVRMMIVTPHLFPTYPQAYANNILWQQYLLQRGNNSQAFSGNIEDLYLPINRDMCSVQYDKVTYVTQDAIYAMGLVPADAYVSADVRNLTKMFNINVKCKNKVITYESNGIGAANNFGPVLLVGYAFMDGSSPDVLTSRLTLWRVNTARFVDL